MAARWISTRELCRPKVADKTLRGRNEYAAESAAQDFAAGFRRAHRTSADTGGDADTSANVRNWMECVRSRKTPNAHIEAGYSHSVALCMTIAAIQTGRRITFDDAKQEVVTGA